MEPAAKRKGRAFPLGAIAFLLPISFILLIIIGGFVFGLVIADDKLAYAWHMLKATAFAVTAGYGVPAAIILALILRMFTVIKRYDPDFATRHPWTEKIGRLITIALIIFLFAVIFVMGLTGRMS